MCALNLRAETHLHSKRHIDITREVERRDATDRDRILERALGIHEIPLDDSIGRLELTELGIVRLL